MTKIVKRTDILERIKDIVHNEGLTHPMIYLFGSQARGDSKKESDWDFLILFEDSLTAESKKKVWFKIYSQFHHYFPYTSVDIILKDLSAFEEEKKIANTISNEVYIEGVQI